MGGGGRAGWSLKPEGQRHGGVLSVSQRLIELEGTARSVVGNRFRIGGVEPIGLIEPEQARPRFARCPRRPSGRQWRGSGGEIEIGEDGVYGKGIGDEGDDAHRSTTTTLCAVPRADERQDIIDASDEGGPSRGSTPAWGGSVRRTRGGLSAELP